MRMHQVTIEDAVYSYSMDDDQRTKCRDDFLVNVKELLPDAHKHEYRDNFEALITDDQFVIISIDKRFKMDVVQTVNLTTTQDMGDIVRKFEMIARKMEDIASKHDILEQNYNTKCEVHTPGNTLTLYNEVTYHLDMCTEELQEELRKGWRIIAVCPQPDQRRPDYVVGRYNPDYRD